MNSETALPGTDKSQSQTLARRVVSGVLLGAGLLLTLFCVPSIVLLAVLAAVTAMATLEVYRILDAAGIPSFRYFGMWGGVVLIAATYLSLGASSLFSRWPTAPLDDLDRLALMLMVMVVILRQFPQKHNNQPLVTIGCTLLGALYVPYLMSYFTRLAFAWEPVAPLSPIGPTSRILILYIIAVVKAVDTGAFLVGSTIGRHKLFPRISPRKTWEGLLGGIAAAMAVSFAFFFALRDPHASASALFGVLRFHRMDALVLGLVLSGGSVLGDLAESLMKRAAGAKDSSRAIPGMGGILDVLDSLLFTVPLFYFYARFFMR